MATWKFIDRDGTLSCARCLAGLRDGQIVHLPGCRAAGVSTGDYEVDLIINLKDQELAHAEGSKCKCSGEVPVLTAAAVQRLHEQARPKGTLYAENCLDPACRDALSECS